MGHYSQASVARSLLISYRYRRDHRPAEQLRAELTQRLSAFSQAERMQILNTPLPKDKSLLYWAAQAGKTNLVMALLSCGARQLVLPRYLPGDTRDSLAPPELPPAGSDDSDLPPQPRNTEYVEAAV